MDADLKEALPYYIALQPKFREAMGEWQDGDWGLSEGEDKPGICIDAEFLNSAERAGAKVPIRLPLPIDPRCPERGLWGMVRWGWKAGTISIFIEDRTGNMRIFGNTENDAKMINVTRGYVSPELALLCALCHQEGVTP